MWPTRKKAKASLLNQIQAHLKVPASALSVQTQSESNKTDFMLNPNREWKRVGREERNPKDSVNPRIIRNGEKNK